MEKYRKFADPSNGINPFIPNSIKSRSLVLKIIYVFQVLFGIKKFFAFVIIYHLFALLQTLRHLFISAYIKRKIEVFLSFIFCRILLIILGVWKLNYKYKKQDSKRVPNLIFSSQSSIIDWMILMYNYSPKFLWIVKSEDNLNDLFVELSYFHCFYYGLGLKFLEHKANSYKIFNLEKYILQTNHTPLVIFPECTKTNRQAVLSIRSNLLDSIYTSANEHERLLIRSEYYEKNYSYFCPINTTEYYGFGTLFFTSCQMYNSVEIYSQDIPNLTFDKKSSFDWGKYNLEQYLDSNLQGFLFEPNHRISVSLTSKDHMAFLEYFHETSKDKEASYVIKKSD